MLISRKLDQVYDVRARSGKWPSCGFLFLYWPEIPPSTDVWPNPANRPPAPSVGLCQKGPESCWRKRLIVGGMKNKQGHSDLDLRLTKLSKFISESARTSVQFEENPWELSCEHEKSTWGHRDLQNPRIEWKFKTIWEKKKPLKVFLTYCVYKNFPAVQTDDLVSTWCRWRHECAARRGRSLTVTSSSSFWSSLLNAARWHVRIRDKFSHVRLNEPQIISSKVAYRSMHQDAKFCSCSVWPHPRSPSFRHKDQSLQRRLFQSQCASQLI